MSKARRSDDDRAQSHLRLSGLGTPAELERHYNASAIDEFTDFLLASEDDTDMRAKKQARKQLVEQNSTSVPPRLRLQLSLHGGYAPANVSAETRAARGTVFSPHPIVLTLEWVDGPYRSVDLLSVPALVQRWREAILAHSNELPDQVRALLSGHNADGSPVADPHLAFLPLAFVGHEHADGRLLGVALTLPRDVTPENRRLALRAIAGVKRLALGSLRAWDVISANSDSQPGILQPQVWTAHPEGSTHWSTVTPIVLDRHPKAQDRAGYQREIAEMIATACTRVVLPRPRGDCHPDFLACRRAAIVVVSKIAQEGHQRTTAMRTRSWCLMNRCVGRCWSGRGGSGGMGCAGGWWRDGAFAVSQKKEVQWNLPGSSALPQSVSISATPSRKSDAAGPTPLSGSHRSGSRCAGIRADRATRCERRGQVREQNSHPGLSARHPWAQPQGNRASARTRELCCRCQPEWSVRFGRRHPAKRPRLRLSKPKWRLNRCCARRRVANPHQWKRRRS